MYTTSENARHGQFLHRDLMIVVYKAFFISHLQGKYQARAPYGQANR